MFGDALGDERTEFILHYGACAITPRQFFATQWYATVPYDGSSAPLPPFNQDTEERDAEIVAKQARSKYAGSCNGDFNDVFLVHDEPVPASAVSRSTHWLVDVCEFG
jgi:hypothetical protein